MPKYIIFNPDDGEIVYYGGKPSEPLTEKKQSLMDAGYRLKKVENFRGANSGRRDHMKWDGKKVVSKSDNELAAMKAKVDSDEAEARKEYLRKLKAELASVEIP